jgi:hypothetical protein
VSTTDIDEIFRRLTAVEEEQATIREMALLAERAMDRCTVLEQDVTDLKMVFGQQRKVLNTIGRIQSEQHATLTHQGEAIGGLVLEVAEIRHAQAGQTLMLAEHRQMLTEHGQTLTEHGRMLRQILDRLPAHEN